MTRLRPCLDCDRIGPWSRCPEHAAAQLRAKRGRRPYTPREQARRAAAVAEHVARNGEWCPGWGSRPTHTAPRATLTADHVTPVAAGGLEEGPLAVLCRSCNSAKGARTT